MEGGFHLLSFATGNGELFDVWNEMGFLRLGYFVAVDMDGIRNDCLFFEGKVRSGTHRRRIRIDKSSHADCLEEMCVFQKEPRRQICKHMHKPVKA